MIALLPCACALHQLSLRPVPQQQLLPMMRPSISPLQPSIRPELRPMRAPSPRLMEEEFFDLSAVAKAMEAEMDERDARILERRAEQAAAGWAMLTGLIDAQVAPPKGRVAQVEAARALADGREALVAAIMDRKPPLPRVEEEDGWIVDELLREAARRLLVVDEDDEDKLVDVVDGLDATDPSRAFVWAQVAKHIARGGAVPQGLGESAGESLRTVMQQICDEGERVAWATSGGLL